MATPDSAVGLPPGFELEEQPSPHGLPPGFELEQPHTAAPPAPKDYDPWPEDQPPPDGYNLISSKASPTGKSYIVHKYGWNDFTHALNDLPGVGTAAAIGQGITRLAGKAASGVAGIFGGPDTVHNVQDFVNRNTELPQSNDPIQVALRGVNSVAQKVAAPVDRAVGNLPPGLRTTIEGVEEAVPDIASLVPGMQGARAARAASVASEAAPIAGTDIEAALKEAGYQNLPRQAADSTVAQRAGASVAGEPQLAQQQTLTNQGVTDELGRTEAGIPQGQKVTYKTLADARAAGPAKTYDAAHGALNETLQADPELQGAISSIGDTTSQLPRSPDVDALKQTMLDQPQMTRDQLFSNIQQSRERAAKYYKAEEPDSEAMGDAYSALANAYEDFVGRQLPKDGPVSLQDWQNARTQFAKSYTVQSALKGTSIDASKIAQLQAKNPTQLTDGLRLIAEQHNRFPLSTGFGPRTFAPEGIGASGSVPGIVARHATGPAVGAATGYALGGTGGAAAGGAAGLLSSAAFQGFLRRWLGGNPEAAQAAAAGAATNPRLGYHFGPQNEPLPAGFNRSPPSIAGLLPAPPMVNAGGGVATPNILESLGLTPDVQAAGAAHPGAPRAPTPGPQAPLEQVPSRPMERVNFTPSGDFSGVLQPNGRPPAPAGGQGGIPLADLLSEGVEQRPAPGLTAGPMGAPAPQGIPFQRNAAHEAGGLSLADEFSPAARENNADVAGVRSQGVPEGVASRAAPKGVQTEHAADEQTGVHTVTTPNGEATAVENGPYLQVKRSDVSAGARGAGEGMAMMERLAYEAGDRGLKLASDVSVSPDAQKLYAALKKRGFTVTRDPGATVNPTTGNLISSDLRKPVFVVTPKTRPLAEAFAQ